MKSLLTKFAPLTAAAITILHTSCTPIASGGGASAYLADYRNQPANPSNPSNPGTPAANEKGYWDGDGVQGSPLIKINIADQKAYFYKGNQLVGQSPISTGKEGKITPKGRFKVTQKSEDHASSLYGVIKDDATGAIVNDNADTRKDFPKAGQTFVHAPMLNFLRFNGAIGMHTGHLPGYAASHGCVRLPDNMARHFFQNASLGTPVIVE